MIHDPFLDPPRRRRSIFDVLRRRRRHEEEQAAIRAFESFRDALRVDEHVPPGKAFIVAPPTTRDDFFNRADPGCELCDGFGFVRGVLDPRFPDGVTPCYCTARDVS